MKATLTVCLFGMLLWYQPCPAQIQESFFGLHQNKYREGEPWPTVPFGILRTVSGIVKWSDLETCQGGPDPSDPCYHWGTNARGGSLDKIVNDASAHSVDVMFTVYSVPEFASNHGPRCRGAGLPDATCAGPPDDECSSRKFPRLRVIGSCDPPHDVDKVVGSGDGDGTDKIFKDFITAMARRYGKKIKYWELWNEATNVVTANPQTFTVKQFARMTKDFRDVVKGMNPDAVILGANVVYSLKAGSPRFRTWIDDYFGALDKYGPTVVDGISYHGYGPPERIVELVQILREAMEKHTSTRGKPVYDTEDAWVPRIAAAGGNVDWDVLGSWLARSLILRAAEGSKSYIFFGWDLFPNGQMWSRQKEGACSIPNRDAKEGYLCPTALVYERVRTWLLGAVFERACAARDQSGGSVWSCDFTKNNGSYKGRFVWFNSRGGSTSYTPDRTFAQVRDLDGNSTALKANGTFSLNQKPVLLEVK